MRLNVPGYGRIHKPPGRSEAGVALPNLKTFVHGISNFRHRLPADKVSDKEMKINPPYSKMSKLQGQPGGLPDISRGLSASATPGTPSKRNRTPEGCQNLSRNHFLESPPPGCITIALAVRGCRLTPFSSTPG
jgi:hypothetical protein